jgi:hypothetical protein
VRHTRGIKGPAPGMPGLGFAFQSAKQQAMALNMSWKLLLAILPLVSGLVADDHAVLHLPGAKALKSKHYAGYLPVDETAGRQLFYYLVESERDPVSCNCPQVPCQVFCTASSIATVRSLKSAHAAVVQSKVLYMLCNACMQLPGADPQAICLAKPVSLNICDLIAGGRSGGAVAQRWPWMQQLRWLCL